MGPGIAFHVKSFVGFFVSGLRFSSLPSPTKFFSRADTHLGIRPVLKPCQIAAPLKSTPFFRPVSQKP